MKKNYRWFLPILLFVAFMGCREKRIMESAFLGFDKFQDLSATTLNTGENINRAFGLLIVKNLLIVSDPGLGFHFSVLDIFQDKKLTDFGKLGEGPCELSFPSDLQRVFGSYNQIGVTNRNNFSYQEYNLDEILSNSGDLTCVNFEGKFNFNYQKIIKVDSGLFVGTGLFPERFALSKSGDKEPYSYFGKYPFQNELQEYDHNVLAMAYQGDILFQPFGKRFVSTSIYSFNFDIVEINEQVGIEQVSQNHFWPPSFKGSSGSFIQAVMNADNRFGCLSTTVTENLIYILFSGKTNKGNAMYSDMVMVYDWDGNPIRILNLDKELNLIAVSENDDYLIGYVDDGKANLYKFDLK